MGNVDRGRFVLREEELLNHREIGFRMIQVFVHVPLDFEQAVVQRQACRRFDRQPFDAAGGVPGGRVHESKPYRGQTGVDTEDSHTRSIPEWMLLFVEKTAIFC